MTKDDLFHDDKDLIEHASQLLKTRKPRQLVGTLSSDGENRRISIETKNLDRVDVLANNRPVATLDVTDGATSVPLAGAPVEVRLEGYSEGKMVAIRRL